MPLGENHDKGYRGKNRVRNRYSVSDPKTLYVKNCSIKKTTKIIKCFKIVND